jgi:glycogen operon protein
MRSAVLAPANTVKLSTVKRPLGARWDGAITTFGVYSAHATSIELCIFTQADSGFQEHRYHVPSQGDGFWHISLPDVGPGTRYGFRVLGPYAPREGHLFNPNKLLIDPYALTIVGEVDWNGPVFGYAEDHGIETGEPDRQDSAPFVPKSLVVDPLFDWGEDARPSVSWEDTIVYETHVKGLTALHPAVPPEQRGTYLGAVHPAVIQHLKALGVTAIELLPIHSLVDERSVAYRGLTNYWGYNSIGFFAPNSRYSSSSTPGDEIVEFKRMVKAFHEEGIEVLLDVVYNHSAEGNHVGPTLAFRGLDNVSYYRLSETDRRYCEDFTGTGNTLDIRQPIVMRLIMDSLRYWVEEMHVDGFRFDLAPALARDAHNPDPNASLFKAIFQDPILSGVKLIAEPWDLGPSGYMLGKFPRGWSEWNDKFRDAARAFWIRDPSALHDLAYRLTGSSDVFAELGKSPSASVNFVTAHDGFTLEDLVSYRQKHNLVNGEENKDGSNHNFSVNHGIEGPTDDAKVLASRDRHKRNLLATLFFAQGVPMLLGGDELGRTQLGNNNAYCLDSEVGWFDWSLDERDEAILRFVQRLAMLRAKLRAVRRRSFFCGKSVGPWHERDLVWYQHDGSEMTHAAWNAHELSSAALRFSADVKTDEMVSDEDWLVIMLNQSLHMTPFVMPNHPGLGPGKWRLELLTTESDTPNGVAVSPGESYGLDAESIALWSWQRNLDVS